MEAWRQVFEVELQRVSASLYAETGDFHAACRYALGGQGKRTRPLLALAAAEACGVDLWRLALPAAVAVEMVHTYSLVHDDLPCMDDDALRRGRPTTHTIYGDAVALLAGDALLTDAFSFLAERGASASDQRVGMVAALARAAGGSGMVYGQSLDMSWTGRSGYAADDLDAIHRNKTGQLVAASCLLGAWAAGASAEQRGRMQSFGANIGLAFQIIDDLLDDTQRIGKTPGKDKEAGKLTYLSVMTAEQARVRAQTLTAEAMHSLESFGPSAAALRELASQLLERTF